MSTVVEFDAVHYDDLTALARRCLRRYAAHSGIDAASLVHECYIRLCSPAAHHVREREHYFHLAARIMRQLLFDGARRQALESNYFDFSADCAELMRYRAPQAEPVDDVREALQALGQVSVEAKRVVECRFFGGLSEAEAAAALGMSLRSVQRVWQGARRWLAEHLQSQDDGTACDLSAAGHGWPGSPARPASCAGRP